MKAAIEIPELLHPIARILKTYGSGEEFSIKLLDCSHDEIQTKEPVYVQIDGLPVPFLIGCVRRKGETQAIIRLEPDCSHIAEQMVGKEILVNADTLLDKNTGNFTPDLLVGFKLLDEEGKFSGKITEFLDYPGNPCIEVELDGHCYTVPLADELITDFEPEKHTLKMIIPEGLK